MAATDWWKNGGTTQHAAKRPRVPGVSGTFSNAGRPVMAAHGTPPERLQPFIDAGVPIDYRQPHRLGTSQWNYDGPTLLPWQRQQSQPAGGDGVSLASEFGGGYGGGNMGNIRTSIVPRPIYSPQQTHAATNLAVAEQHAAGNLPSLLKQFDSQGISRGPAHMARALPLVASARQAAARTRAQLPLEDAFANAQAVLGGENARENEAIALANLGLRFRGNEQDLVHGLARQRMGNAGTAFSMVDSLFG